MEKVTPAALWLFPELRLCRDDNARQAVAYQIGRRGLREGQSSGDDEDMILLLTDTNLRTHKTHHIQITRGSCVVFKTNILNTKCKHILAEDGNKTVLTRLIKTVTYCNVTACEVSPTKQVHDSVEAGQFTADLFLSFHHSITLHTKHVVYWSHHSQTCVISRTINASIEISK